MGFGIMRRTMRFLPAILLLLIMSESSFGAGQSRKERAQDTAKTRIARIQNFLLRAVEDLDKSLAYEKAVIEDLEKRYDAAQKEPPYRGKDLREFLDWHQRCADWLTERLSEFEADLAGFFSGEPSQTAWADRYAEMAEDYGLLAEQLAQKTRRIDEARELNEAGIEKLKRVIEYYEFIKERRDKKNRDEKRKPDRKAPDDWAFYKDLDDYEIERMKREVGERRDQRKHYDVLREQARYEMNWLLIKSADSAALSSVARALMADSPEAIEAACNGIVKHYESDVSLLQREVKEIDRKRTDLARTATGTLGTLDRIEELSDYYATMKRRLERHIQWLKQQIGGYRADVIQLAKEKKRE